MPKRFLATIVTLPLLLGLVTMAPTHAMPGVGPCDLSPASGESVPHLMRRRIALGSAGLRARAQCQDGRSENTETDNKQR